MPRSLTEIAHELEELRDTLTSAGQAIAGNDAGGFIINRGDGTEIDLDGLISDVRHHAQDRNVIIDGGTF